MRDKVVIMEAGERKTGGVLAVDVGNTVTRLGLFDADGLQATWDTTTPERLTADEARLVFASFWDMLTRRAERADKSVGRVGLTGEFAPILVEPRDAIVSCVVPDLTDVWVSALRTELGRRPLVVGPGLKTGVKMRYHDPSEMGSDRMADLVAVSADYGAPLVVVDLGTTTNFEVIDADGAFVGGIIAPGLALGARALARAAARLPHIELKAPASVIGKSTREAMQSGAVMGEVARIDGLIDLVLAELGCEAGVVITGTNAKAMAALISHEATADDTLTLRGLFRLYGMNRRK